MVMSFWPHFLANPVCNQHAYSQTCSLWSKPILCDGKLHGCQLLAFLARPINQQIVRFIAHSSDALLLLLSIYY